MLLNRSPQDIVKQGVIEVSTRELFDLEGGGRKPKKNGALDGRLVRFLDTYSSRLAKAVLIRAFRPPM